MIIMIAIVLVIGAPIVGAAELPQADYSSLTQLIRDLPPGVSKKNPFIDTTPYIGKRIIVDGALHNRYPFGTRFMVTIWCRVPTKYSDSGTKVIDAEFDPNDEAIAIIEAMKLDDQIKISGKIKQMSGLRTSPFLRLSDCILLNPTPRPKTP